MRNTRWLRYGLASIIVGGAGLGAGLVACGDDDDVGGVTPVPDGSPGDGSGGDTGTGDAADAADAAKPTFAKLTMVNATTDMGPNMALTPRGDAAIRVCFKQGTTQANLGVAPYPPLPDKPAGGLPVPGIIYGTGGTFPSFGLDLESRIIVPIVMNARTLAQKGIVNPGNNSPGTTCDELVGDTKDAAAGLVANQDYWELPAIPAGTFLKEKAYVLALTGCVGDAQIPNKDKCGPGFDATMTAPGVGNLKVSIYETTRTPISATAQGIQVLHAASATAAVIAAFGAGDTVFPGFTSNPADGGNWREATEDGIKLNTLTAPKATDVKDSDFAALAQTSPLAPPSSLAPFPLPFVQALSGLGAPTAPTVYVNGKNYVYIMVGDIDPATPTFSHVDGGGPGDGGDGSQFNTRFFHFLAFPTDPEVVAYKP